MIRTKVSFMTNAVIGRLAVCAAALLFISTTILPGCETTGQGGMGGGMGGMPGGMGGMPGGMQGGMPPGGGGGSFSAKSLSGAYTVDNKTVTETDITIKASKKDQSGVYVLNNGDLTLINPTIITTGDTSNQSNSSFYGLNAIVLANSGGKVTIKGGTLTSTGEGANGAMATESKAVITLSDLTIKATGGGGHGVMATGGGTITCTNVDMYTEGRSGAPIALDRGGGTVTVDGGEIRASGGGSPVLYSTGILTVKNIDGVATGSEAAVIEGKNTVDVTDSILVGYKECGAMIYQSMSGDAAMGVAHFNISGGTFEAKAGPLFFITNTTADVKMTNVKASATSGVFIRASSGRWGNSGSNGGKLTLTMDRQSMEGNIEIDNISTIDAVMQNDSHLKGAINANDKGKEMNLTMDASSTWEVTADSNIRALTLKGGISGDSVGNIIGNGFTVYYNKSKSKGLDGKTYNLAGGGKLTPKN